jgi:hypothetical protein
MSQLTKIISFAFITVSILGGCASYKPPTVSLTQPEIGSVTTKGVGEKLLMQGTGQMVPQLTVSEDQAIGEYTLSKGQYTFSAENVVRVKFMRGDREIYLMKADNSICVDKVNDSHCGVAKYTIDTVFGSRSGKTFQQTLLYNGKIGNKVTLAYREFAGNSVRPASSNEVTYDLSESMILGYKGVRIEVIKATNADITYKVLSGFE